MGGIKNLEAKKKANHVVSSGAGGGTKGPSVIDKRNQEVKCPYCDRVYTQAQSGRLKDHIAKQHADQAAAAGDGPQASSSGTASTSKGGASAAAAASASTASTSSSATQQRPGSAKPSSSSTASQPGSSSAAGQGANRPAAAGAKGGAAAGGSTAAPTAAPGPATAGGGGGGGGMMDVGSKAGYYTSKSPKLHLYEWCQREGRPRPRFSVRQQPDGSWTCKVVLPDPKKSEDDVVLFLDPSHSAPEGPEAEQRACVMALEAVAGDRKYDSLLPKQYVAIWKEMGEVRQRRKAEEEARARAQEERRARDRERAARMSSRAPQIVTMSREKQALVQAILQERLAAGGGGVTLEGLLGLSAADAAAVASGAAQSAGTSGGGWASDPELLDSLIDQLVEQGFTGAQAQMAVDAVASGGRGGSAAPPPVESLIEWLLIHLPPDQQPSHFTKGGSNAVTLISGLKTGAGSSASLTHPGGSEVTLPSSDLPTGAHSLAVEQLQSVSRLAAYGYTASACEEALQQSGGEELGALCWLYDRLTGNGGATTSALAEHQEQQQGEASPVNPGDAWTEECMVLGAIYGEENVTCSGGSSDSSGGDGSISSAAVVPGAEGCTAYVAVQVPLPDPCPAALQNGGTKGTAVPSQGGPVLTLGVYLIGQASCSAYPETLPLITLSCPALRPSHLRRLTRTVAAAAQKLRGEAMLHELVSTALETLGALTLDDGSDTEELALQRGPGSTTGTTPGGGAVRQGGTVKGTEYADEAEGEQDESLLEEFEGLGVADAPGDDTADDATSLSSTSSTTVTSGSSTASGSGGTAARGAVQEGARGALGQAVPQALHARGGGGTRRGRAPPSPAELAAESERLLRHQKMLQEGPQHAEMRRVRGALPAAGKRGELLAALAAHAVVVISGATGCGKSTQVPQYILEESISGGQGAATSIIVTQPRRISALGLAQRVAQERGEEVGDTVGYSVRLDTRASARTRLLFCTTGILLRRLLSEPLLDGVTHVVLDEVHERSIEIDLLLLLLRDVVIRRATAGTAGTTQPSGTTTPLRLILMSATADADLFATYMHQRLAPAASASSNNKKGAAGGGNAGLLSGVAQLTIPGFTHPVRELYLEDALEVTGYVVGRNSRYAKKGKESDTKSSTNAGQSGGNKGARSKAGSATGKGGGGGGGEDVPESWEADGEEGTQRGGGAGDPQGGGIVRHYSDQTLRSLALVDEEAINYELLASLVTYLVAQQQEHGPRAVMQVSGQQGGAILVFLPGAPEISRALRTLTGHDQLIAAAGGANRLRVVPLHGSLSAKDQSLVFNRPPPGVFKVVLATNVAETSITIDDVSFVIDTGRAKEMSHDPDRGILRLQEQWVSQAAAQQRRGRAGRVRPGICFRLFSRGQWGRMPSHTVPEMLRSPLESVCLLIKGMVASHEALKSSSAAAAPAQGSSSQQGTSAAASSTPPVTTTTHLSRGSTQPVAAILKQCLSPPSPAAVESALTLLRQIGALDSQEALTALGHHLKQMPMDPRIGKMLIFGALLTCLDPVLTIASAMAHGRPVFMSPGPDAKDDVETARRELLAPAISARSDHIALVAAFNTWARLLAKGGRGEATSFCTRCALSESSLEAIAAGRAEYAGVLSELGFLPRRETSYLSSRGRRNDTGPGSEAHKAWMALPANAGAADARYLKAAVMAGFYPSVLRVQHPPPTYAKVDGGAIKVESDPATLKFFDRSRGRAFIHPGSVNFKVGEYASGWLVYTQMTATSKLFVRESSMAPIYSLLLFGGELRVIHDRRLITVDDWAEFQAPPNVGVLVKVLRQELDAVLAAKITNPGLDVHTNKCVSVIMSLLATDGF